MLLSAVRLKQLGRAASKHLPPGLSAGADQGAQSKLLRSKVRIVAEADTHTHKKVKCKKKKMRRVTVEDATSG